MEAQPEVTMTVALASIVIAVYAVVTAYRAMRQITTIRNELFYMQGEGRRELESIKVISESVEEQERAEPKAQLEEARPKVPARSLEDIVSRHVLESVLIFDSLGQVIDHLGVKDPERTTALVAELAAMAGMSSDGPEYIILGGKEGELVARIGKLGDKTLFIYAKLMSTVTPDIAQMILGSARSYVEEILSRRLA